jgi:hypothetical protein
MTNRISTLSPRRKARLAGFCYLITIGVGVFDHLVVGGRLIVPGDAAATAHHILASAPLYRLAFALDLIPVYAVVTVLFYELFKPVNRSLSLLAALSSLLGGAVGSITGVFQLAPLLVLGGAPYLHAFSAEQLQVGALVFLNLHKISFTISLVFFGFYCFLLGWLIMGSTFMPRTVGVLMAVGGLAYMTYSFADVVSPPIAANVGAYPLILGAMGEAALTLWLLVVGLNGQRWKAQTAAAELS